MCWSKEVWSIGRRRNRIEIFKSRSCDCHNHRISDADVSLVTEPGAASGQVLVVPQPDGTLSSINSSTTRNSRNGRAGTCVSFVSQDLLDAVDPVPGWAFEDLYPYGYVSEVSGDDVAIGYTEGWLANSGAIGMVRPGADRYLGVCTLRVTDAYGDHPVASVIVDHFLVTLAE